MHAEVWIIFPVGGRSSTQRMALTLTSVTRWMALFARKLGRRSRKEALAMDVDQLPKASTAFGPQRLQANLATPLLEVVDRLT